MSSDCATAPLKTSAKPLRACFFAYVRDRNVLNLCEFYHNDIDILRELGFEVITATRFNEIPLNCDLYFAWWWGTGIQPLVKALYSNKPIIMVGNVRLMKNTVNGMPHVAISKYLCIRLSWQYSTAIVTTSNFEHNIVTRYRTKGTFMVYHGVNTNIYKSSTDLGRQDFIYTICNLYAENAKRKRIDEIIRAFALLLKEYPQYQLIISGGSAGFDDDTMTKMQALARQLNIDQQVIFTGSVTLEEKIRYYQTARVFLQPSMYEGFGLAIAEAMACGTPVVVCPVGAVPEVVGDCGVYVSGTPESIANALVRLIQDENLRHSLAIRGEQRIYSKFSYEKRKRQLADIIKQLTR